MLIMALCPSILHRIKTEPKKGLTKTWRVMRLTAIIILAACLQVSARGTAQTITLREKNASLEEIFKEIGQQSGLPILYTRSMLEHAQKVTVNLQEASLEHAMKEVLKDQPLSYSIINNTVVIKATPQPLVSAGSTLFNLPPTPIRGRVTDAEGNPLSGASVSVKNGKNSGVTNAEGVFSLNVSVGDVLIVTYVGYEPAEYKITTAVVASSDQQPSPSGTDGNKNAKGVGSNPPNQQQKANPAGNGSFNLVITLKPSVTKLEDVTVEVNTGYQQIPKDRVTGSFDVINQELFNRRVSTDVLSRIDGVASGVIFVPPISHGVNEKLGINIRGVSTISGLVNADPLIVLDNFPYNGDLNNLNPNDIASVTVLKDAAAASIWGARAGNGVIVITTKKGRYNQKLRLDLNANVTTISKPDIFYNRNYIPAKDYIEAEKYLFNQGYFDYSLSDNNNFPVISPIVEILNAQRNGQISSADADVQLGSLSQNDVRKDFDKYVYRKSLKQQYALNISGGSNNLNYNVSLGWDKNTEELVRNNNDRISMRSFATYRPINNLEISLGFTYTRSAGRSNNTNGFGAISPGGQYSTLYPYAGFVNSAGMPVSFAKSYRQSYIDSVEQRGFLDWNYNPLREIQYGDNSSKIDDILLNASIRYQIVKPLNIEVDFQNEKQTGSSRNYYSQSTYFTRNLINQFTVVNPGGSLFYQFPLGGILFLGNNELTSNNIRAQLNFSQDIGTDHSLVAIAGAEMRDAKSISYQRDAYGYDDNYGSAVTNIDFSNYLPINPTGFNQIPQLSGNISGTENRYISYYTNAAYTYKSKYTLTASARKDGTNIFGVRTNDRVTPLWSLGLGWDISREDFYKSNALPVLKLRASLGYNGNVYNGAAYLISRYTLNSVVGTPSATIVSPPNENLRWERVRNINLGVDFSTKRNMISGTWEVFQKNGSDLIDAVPLPPSTGFPFYTANSANNRVRGTDLTLNANIGNRKFKWLSTLLFTYITDKVTKVYNSLPTAIDTANYLISNSVGSNAIPFVGKPLYGLYSYRWGGIDPATGDPLGYLSGKISSNYDSIITTATAGDIVYKGSTRPKYFGSFRNTFVYKRFSISANVVYKLGYVFKRNTTSLNYEDILSNPNIDFAARWQKPGDEKISSVPSVLYQASFFRNYFYQFSESLIEKGDFVRLQDIQADYDMGGLLDRFHIPSMHVYLYVNNIGIIWRANKKGIDPDYYGGSAIPAPRSFSIGCRLGL